MWKGTSTIPAVQNIPLQCKPHHLLSDIYFLYITYSTLSTLFYFQLPSVSDPQDILKQIQDYMEEHKKK